jgi:hypothetical protein
MGELRSRPEVDPAWALQTRTGAEPGESDRLPCHGGPVTSPGFALPRFLTWPGDCRVLAGPGTWPWAPL